MDGIRRRWFEAVQAFSPLYKEDGLHVLIGDGVKQSKEGRRIPAVKNCSRNQKSKKILYGI